MNRRRNRQDIIDAIAFNSIGYKIMYKEAISMTELAEKMNISKPGLSIHANNEQIKEALDKIGIRSVKRGKVVYFDWNQEGELNIEVI